MTTGGAAFSDFHAVATSLHAGTQTRHHIFFGSSSHYGIHQLPPAEEHERGDGADAVAVAKLLGGFIIHIHLADLSLPGEFHRNLVHNG